MSDSNKKIIPFLIIQSACIILGYFIRDVYFYFLCVNLFLFYLLINNTKDNKIKNKKVKNQIEKQKKIVEKNKDKNKSKTHQGVFISDITADKLTNSDSMYIKYMKKINEQLRTIEHMSYGEDKK